MIFIAFKATLFLALWIYKHFPVQLIHFEHFAIEDVEFNDIYYSTRGEDDKILHQPKEVVLINTGSIPADTLFRQKAAGLIRKLELYRPAAIGIDLFFGPDKKSAFDITLAEVIVQQRNLVMAVNKDSLRHQMVSSEYTGIVNLPISQQHKETVRKYYSYVVQGKDTLPSFALQLARLKDPAIKAGAPLEYLRYCCVYQGYYNIFDKKGIQKIHNNFPAIEAIDLLNDKDTTILRDFLMNKIVILGHLGRDSMFSPWDVEDKYMVPTDSSLIHHRLLMPGAVIHANAVQSMIKGEHFIEMKGWRHELITDVILFMFLFLFFMIRNTFTLYKTVNIIVIILSTIPIIFLLGPWLMTQGIYFRTGSLFLQVAFVEEFMEIAEGVIHKFKNRKKK